jgi:hypothetical protein
LPSSGNPTTKRGRHDTDAGKRQPHLDLDVRHRPIALGAAADLFGADATLGVTALLLVVVSLVFWRLPPESFRPSGI